MILKSIFSKPHLFLISWILLMSFGFIFLGLFCFYNFYTDLYGFNAFVGCLFITWIGVTIFVFVIPHLKQVQIENDKIRILKFPFIKSKTYRWIDIKYKDLILNEERGGNMRCIVLFHNQNMICMIREKEFENFIDIVKFIKFKATLDEKLRFNRWSKKIILAVVILIILFLSFVI